MCYLLSVRLTLDYWTRGRPRAGLATCVALAGNLLGLAICLVAPIALSLAGAYWDSTTLIISGFLVAGLCLVCALLLAVMAVETICDLLS